MYYKQIEAENQTVLSSPPAEVNEPAIPNVSMEVAVGKYLKPGQTVEFDYDEFHRVATDMGINDRGIENLDINIGERGLKDPFGRMDFDGDEDDAQPFLAIGFNKKPAFLRRRFSDQHLSDTLVHETQHYADVVTGVDSRDPSDEYIAAMERGERGMKMLFLGTVAFAAYLVTKESTAALTAMELVPAGYVQALRGELGYANDEGEKRAFAAEERYKDSRIIQVTDRTD